MLDIGTVWKKVQEFIKRIGDLEDGNDENKKDVAQLKREMAIQSKELGHSDKIQAHQGKAIADLEVRIKKLESEKHGLAIKAGRAKAKVARLEERTKH